MKAILFPGQGSQKAGMLSEFLANFNIVKNVLQNIDDRSNLALGLVNDVEQHFVL